MNVIEAITHLLKDKKITFRLREHAPTLTSADSARERGEQLSSGAKAILYKVQNDFFLFVLAANQKLDTRKIKTHFKSIGRRSKKSRFATIDELKKLTGLVPGSVPPFGKPILPFELFVDPSLLNNEKISFNAGSLEHSITMNIEDYLGVANPVIFSFSDYDEENQVLLFDRLPKDIHD